MKDRLVFTKQPDVKEVGSIMEVALFASYQFEIPFQHLPRSHNSMSSVVYIACLLSLNTIHYFY